METKQWVSILNVSQSTTTKSASSSGPPTHSQTHSQIFDKSNNPVSNIVTMETTDSDNLELVTDCQQEHPFLIETQSDLEISSSVQRKSEEIVICPVSEIPDNSQETLTCNQPVEPFCKESTFTQQQNTDGGSNEGVKDDICLQSLPHDVQLMQHIEDQHDSDDYRCHTECDSSFDSLSSTRKDAQTSDKHKTRIRQRCYITCDECSQSFRNDSLLNKHMEKMHQMRTDRPATYLTRSTRRPRKSSQRMLRNLSNIFKSEVDMPETDIKQNQQTDNTLDKIGNQMTNTCTQANEQVLLDLRVICEKLESEGKDILVLMAEEEKCQWWGSSVARECISKDDAFINTFINHCNGKRKLIVTERDKTRTPKRHSKTKKKQEAKTKRRKTVSSNTEKRVTRKSKRLNEDNVKDNNNKATSEEEVSQVSDNAAEVLETHQNDIYDNGNVLSDGAKDKDEEVKDAEDDGQDDGVIDASGDLIFKNIFPDDSCQHHCMKCNSAFLTVQQLYSHQYYHPACASDKLLSQWSRADILQEIIAYTDPDLKVEVSVSLKSLLESQTTAPFKCLVCHASVTRRRGLFTHLQTHIDNLVFPCNICSKQYKCVTTMMSHMKLHARRPYSCLPCERLFRTEGELMTHKAEGRDCIKGQSYKSDNRLEHGLLHCYVCAFVTEFSLEFQTHAEDHVQRGETECQACFSKFPVLHEFIEHMKTEQQSSNKPFLCACGKSFKDKVAYNRHNKLHQEPKFKCEQCDKMFHDKGNLRAHQRCHDEVKPYVCDFCGAAYRKKIYFENHRRLHTGDTPFKCDVEGCEKAFRGLQSLTQHKRTHNKIGAYICDICGRIFKQPGLLNYHRKNHTMEWRWPCNYCTEKFKSCWSYKRHLANHHGDKKDEIERTTNIRLHECPVCKKMYHEMEDMRRHMNNHKGIKPFTCDICNKSFSDRSNLMNHKFIHSDKKKLKCAHCYKMFVHQTNLSAHVEKHHSTEDTAMGTSTIHLIEQNTGEAHVIEPGTRITHIIQPGTGKAHVIEPGTSITHIIQPGTGKAHVIEPGTSITHIIQPGTGKAHVIEPGTSITHVLEQTTGNTHVIEQNTTSLQAFM